LIRYGGNRDEARLLEICYQRCLELADEHKLASLAFPGISTGAYGFPIGPAARIAVETCRTFARSRDGRLREIVFCCFSDADLAVYQKLMD